MEEDLLMIVAFIVGVLYIFIVFGTILAFATAKNDRDIDKAVRWLIAFFVIEAIKNTFKHLFLDGIL